MNNKISGLNPNQSSHQSGRRTTIKRLATGVVLSSLSLMLGLAQAADKQKVLTIASWLPPDAGMNTIFWPQFIKQIETLTDGRVTGKIEYNLAPVPALIDLVEDGGADVSWVFHGYTPGRFTTSKMAELPGFAGNSEAASVAYWQAYEKFFKPADEYKGLQLIGLMVHDPSYLLMASKIESLDAVKGKKLRLPGGVGSDVGKAFGAVPVLVPAPKIYETIANKIADGVLLPADLFTTLKLAEVVPQGYEVPGGFYRGTFAVIMNQNSLAGVSDADQAALRAYFGEAVSKVAGKAWDVSGDEGLAGYLKAGGVINPLSAADLEKFNQQVKPIQDSVIAEVNGKGVDGQAAFLFLQAAMQNYQP